MRRLFGIALVLFSLCACGKKGPLVAPESFAPAPINNVKVEQRGYSFEITLSPPGKEEGGGTLSDLAGFILFRRTVLPPAEDCDECADAYAELKHVDLDYLQDVRHLDSLYLIEDPFLKVGETYQYKAVAIKKDGARSKDSNKVRRKVVAPPKPPILQAIPSPTEIELQIAAEPPEKGTISGYSLFRWKKGEVEPIHPLNRAPLTDKSYRDQLVQPGLTYRYKVRSIALIDGETVESSASNTVETALTEPD